MIIFKCKMCGGDLTFEQGASVAECPYCGTNQTLPKLDDDKRANLYDRANHFRRQNEFDKAMAIYEQVLAEDRTDAEAYWSLVLCRYGIEYVEDPASHKRVPTVNRVQYASILADEDYKSALSHADAVQRSVYEAEANAIAEIQKGILDISRKEEPFDVFICYKETDANGRRTPDSVLATELYHELTKEGFKVFFARITLEDKIGTAYEPYIFAALNSARVMVALGTKPEYFNAVWVKNEWSRYLALIKNGADKTLVPAYRDMDPYDLPEEFAHLQAQDMGKLGFMQDLIRGIKKILHKDEPKPQTAAQPTVAAPANNVAPLLERAFMFLEDGDFDRADEFCEQVLNLDPKNGRAYLGKLMAQLKVRKESDLKDQMRPFDGNNNYQKVMRFGNEDLKKQVTGDIDYIKKRNEYERQKGIYHQALDILQMAASVEQCQDAKKRFQSVPDFEGVQAKLKECDAKIESINDENYRKAEQLKAEGRWDVAITAFEKLNDYRYSRQLAQQCRDSREAERKAEEHRRAEERKAEERRREAERKAEEQRREQERITAERKAKEETAIKKKIAIIVGSIAVVVIATVLLYTMVIKPNRIYRMGKKAWEDGDMNNAILWLRRTPKGYKDTGEYLSKAEKMIRYYSNIISSNDSYTMAVNENGTVSVAGRITGQESTVLNEVHNWKEIASVFAGEKGAFGLTKDGSVDVVGKFNYGEGNVGEWKDIIDISNSFYCTFGLRADGTVLAIGKNEYNQCNVDNWNNIVRISSSAGHTIGLRNDGTAVAVGANNRGQCDITKWSNLVDIASAGDCTIGLKSNGTVVITNTDSIPFHDVKKWRDIIAITADDNHIVGLKANGNVIAVGNNKNGQCDVENWKDIVAITAGKGFTIGLKSDGTLVATGDNMYGQREISSWKLWD